jgi:hypothetical protein
VCARVDPKKRKSPGKCARHNSQPAPAAPPRHGPPPPSWLQRGLARPAPARRRSGAGKNNFRPNMPAGGPRCARQGARWKEGRFPLCNKYSVSPRASLLGPRIAGSCFFWAPAGPPCHYRSGPHVFRAALCGIRKKRKSPGNVHGTTPSLRLPHRLGTAHRRPAGCSAAWPARRQQGGDPGLEKTTFAPICPPEGGAARVRVRGGMRESSLFATSPLARAVLRS